MSDEQHKDEEVEAHRRHLVNDEPAAEGETDDEVEAHVRKALPRKNLPRKN